MIYSKHMGIKRKNICVLTGTRAEYGLLRPIMLAIQSSKKLNLKLIVTGMHFSKNHGYSINQINKDGFTVDQKVFMHSSEDTNSAMANSIGKGILKLVKAFQLIKPDLLLILGDRIEPLSGAIAAAYMNIPIAHIHGGDKSSGIIDESARHAITKFSHIHFPATEESAKRIIKLGEQSEKVFVVGAPGLDTILKIKLLTKDELESRLSVHLKAKYVILIQHPVPSQIDQVERQINETLKALKELEYQTIAIYPNLDAGGQKIIKALNRFKKYSFFSIFKNLSHVEYLSLLKHSAVLVGNSSSGMIESSSFNIPVINIGNRQEGRQRSTNVINVSYKKTAIINGIKKALSKNFKRKISKCRNPYGDGNAAARIVKILEKINNPKSLLKKYLTY